MEDLTGGVTTELFTFDILDKELFWKEQLSKVNSEFLFGAWIVGNAGFNFDRQGVVKGHAYSILRAAEANGERFVLVR